MGKKETFDKMTTAQFLLMQLRRRNGKELEARFHTVREQARVLALLKMADSQEIDAMAAVLGVTPEGLVSLVSQMEAQGLVSFGAGAEDVPEAEAASEAAPETAGEAEATPEDETAGEAADEAVEEAADAPAQPAAPIVVRITEDGRAWVQPPVDLPGLLLADFDDDALSAFDAGLDTLVKTLEAECGATAAQLMDEERKRREEAAARPERGPRDGRRDDRGGRGRDNRGGKFGDRDRQGGRGKGGFDRKDRKFDKGRKFDGDSRGGRKFDKDGRGGRKFGDDRRGGYRRDDRGGYGRDDR